MIRLAERVLPLFAPVIHIEAGGAWLIARAQRAEGGLVVDVDVASRVAEVIARTGEAHVLVPIDGGWREQACEAFIVGTSIALVPSAPAMLVLEQGPTPRT